MSNFTDSLDDLNETLKEIEKSAKDLVVGPPLQVTDHLDQATFYLSKAAILALSKKATTQVVQVPGTMQAFMAIYLCGVVKSDNTEHGVKKIASVSNVLAEKGYIHSCLAHMSSIKFAQIPKQYDSSVVFCFPLVPADKVEEIRALSEGLMTEEGGIGLRLDKEEKELPEGQFYGEVYLTVHPFDGLSKEDSLKKHIQEYLNVLPEGTEVVSTKQCAIVSLAVPYEVIFSNPLMKAFKEVKLNHTRHCEIVDGHLKQFNLFNSIEYIKR